MINFDKRFLEDISSVNSLFEFLEINEKLTEIEEYFEKKEVLDRIKNCCFGLSNNGYYLMVVSFNDENKLDLDTIENVASELENYFNKKVVINLISKKPPATKLNIFGFCKVSKIDLNNISIKNPELELKEELEKHKESVIKYENYFNDYCNKSSRNLLYDKVKSDFKVPSDLENIQKLLKMHDVEDELIAIEESDENKKILEEIGDSFVGFNQEGECVIVDFYLTEYEDYDIEKYDDLAYRLWEHFKKPVKLIGIGPYQDYEKLGSHIHRIKYDFE